MISRVFKNFILCIIFQDLPAPEEKARNVIFVDIGHVGVQVAAASFNKGKLTMKACTFDRNNCGGRMFDKVLVKYFAEEFKSKTKLDPLSKPKAVLKLETEVEKIKKQMSANTNKLPLNIGKYIDREKGEHSSETRDLCLMKLSKSKMLQNLS